MSHKYYVDWSDTAFPEIKSTDTFGDWELAPLGRTFTECKAEIREHFQREIDFARNRLRELSALRVGDL